MVEIQKLSRWISGGIPERTTEKFQKQLRRKSKKILGGALEELRRKCKMKTRRIGERTPVEFWSNSVRITGEASKKFPEEL